LQDRQPTEQGLTEQHPPQQARRDYLDIFTVLITLHCVWVLSLALFPTQDGPVHLYLASIFKDLLHHTSTVYSQYYLVRHYLPPYSVQYYLLAAAIQAIPAIFAEKLFICLILISFAYGFRYLATGIGEGGALFSLFGLCLLLNWPLSMGFENYVFSLTLAFWALGLWTRFRSGPGLGKRIAFVLIVFMMTLTHPVPVAIVLGFVALDLGVRAVSRRGRDKGTTGPSYAARNILTFLAASSALLYIAAFTEKQRSAENLRDTIHPGAELRSFYGTLEGIRFFYMSGGRGYDWPAHVYLFALYALLGIAAVVALSRFRGSTDASPTWRVAFVLFLVAMPFVPMDMNGSHMFATRLVLLVWLAAFAAASGARLLPDRAELACATLAIATSLGILWFAHREVSREAHRIAEIAVAPASGDELGDDAAKPAAPEPPENKLGLLLPGLEHHQRPAYDYNVDAFVWAGVHFFRMHSDVLLNTPWTDIPILPVNATPALGLAGFEPATIEFYYELRDKIEQGDPESLRLLSRADFILFTTSGQPVDDAAVGVILRAKPDSQWSCTRNTSWSTLCLRDAKRD